MAVAVAVDVLLEGADEVGALGARPDDRHVAAQDVEELRQLVERQAAHDLADARAAVVALDAAGGDALLRDELLLGGRRRDLHRAELEHVELAPVEPDAALAEEDRAGRAEAHGEREQAHRDRQHQQRDAGEDAVDRVLDAELPAARVDRRGAQQRDAAEVLDFDAVGDLLEQPRHDHDLDAQPATAADHAEQDRVRRGREGDDDLFDVVALDDLLEVPARAEHAQALLVGVVDQRVLVEEADRSQAELRPLAQPSGDQVPDAAGADDQRVEAGLAAAQRTAAIERDADAAGAEEHERERPQAHGLRGQRRVVARDRAHGRERHRRYRRRGEDARDGVDGRVLQAEAVEAARVEDQQRQQGVGAAPGEVREARRRGRGDDRRHRRGEQHRAVGGAVGQPRPA